MTRLISIGIEPAKLPSEKADTPTSMQSTYPKPRESIFNLTLVERAAAMLQSWKVTSRRRKLENGHIRLIPQRASGLRVLRPDDVTLVVLCHDGRHFLPSFLKHYRTMGVTRFLVVDDQSTDGSREYLAVQDDVDMFVSNVRYRDASRGRIWREQLMTMHGVDRWYVNIDIDEYLIYEDCEHRKIGDFTAALDRQGILRCPAPMIDCYPDGPVDGAVFDGSTDAMPWAVAPLFDGSGYAITKTNRAFSMRGGVRSRTFEAEAELMKYPLIYWRDGDSLGVSIHQPVPYQLNFSPIFGVLLHFKFFSDMESRAKAAVSDNQYYDNAREYRKMATAMADGGGDLDFRSPVSIPFRGSKDLMERGFFQPAWR